MAIGKTKVRDLREKWMEAANDAFIGADASGDPEEEARLRGRGTALVNASADLKAADSQDEE